MTQTAKQSPNSAGNEKPLHKLPDDTYYASDLSFDALNQNDAHSHVAVGNMKNNSLPLTSHSGLFKAEMYCIDKVES